MESAALRIRRMRELCNYTQDAVAIELGISQPAYARLESGKTKIDLVRIVQIAAFFKIEPQKLISEERIIDQLSRDPALQLLEKMFGEKLEACKKLIVRLEKENTRLVSINKALIKKI